MIWKSDRFVVSGKGYSFLLGIISVYSLRAAVVAYSDPHSAILLVKASENPIRSDIDSFISALASISHLTAFAHLMFFLRSREPTALSFNNLNSFWVA